MTYESIYYPGNLTDSKNLVDQLYDPYTMSAAISGSSSASSPHSNFLYSPTLRRSSSSSTVSWNSGSLLSPTTPRTENGHCHLPPRLGQKSFTDCLYEDNEDSYSHPHAIAPRLLSLDQDPENSEIKLEENCSENRCDYTIDSEIYNPFNESSPPYNDLYINNNSNLSIGLRYLQVRDCNLNGATYSYAEYQLPRNTPELRGDPIYQTEPAECKPFNYNYTQDFDQRQQRQTPRDAALTALKCVMQPNGANIPRYCESSSASDDGGHISYTYTSSPPMAAPTRRRHSGPELYKSKKGIPYSSNSVRKRRSRTRKSGSEEDLKRERLPLVVSVVDNLFPCEEEDCNRRFKRQEHLRRHALTHTGEKKFGCPLRLVATNEPCGKLFSRSDNLKQHLITHNKGARNGKQTWYNPSFGLAAIKTEKTL